MRWRRNSQVYNVSKFVLAASGSSLIPTEPTEMSPEPAVVGFEETLYHFAVQSRQTYASMFLGHLWYLNSATRGTVSNQYARHASESTSAGRS